MQVHRHRARGALILGALVLLAASCVFEPGDPGPADVVLAIDTTQGRHPISPRIYGSNTARDLSANRLTLIRSGGNRMTAYNWENNASNAGSDWCHQNDGYLSSSSTPGAAVEPMVDNAHASGADAMVTVPIVDHVAADKLGGSGPPSCSGDVANTPNYLATRFRANVADKPGALSLTPNATDGSVYQDEFVNFIEQSTDGQVLYSLDNEPDLWSHTHNRIHPNPVTYAELIERNIRFATAIKSVAPDAIVSGPASYGFYGFERLQGAPDAANRNFLDVWLAAMQAADTAAGRRLVDLLDLHWYPEATGGGVRITGTDTSSAVVAARLQAPRSLWDPTYTENSWITNDYLGGPIALLPTVQERIDTYYPGTGIAITEWNYGGGQHISGALATADALGVFGRENVHAATLWELNADESYTYAAFRAFRNYDGTGGAFEDTSVQALSSNDTLASVYASVDALDPRRVVIIAINKDSQARTAGITLRHTEQFASADVYTVTAAGGANVHPATDIVPVTTNAWNYTMPARSISVIVPEGVIAGGN
jgi:hypothetical protein